MLQQLVGLMTVTLFLTTFAKSAPATGFLNGIDQNCSVEDEPFHDPLLTNDPCLDCRCKKKVIVCMRKRCRESDTCPVLAASVAASSSAAVAVARYADEGSNKQCCKPCKGCHYLGLDYASGQTWMSSQDACRMLSCKGGVITMARIQCATPCRNSQKIAGFCCPVCAFANETSALASLRSANDEGTSYQDPCLQCNCDGRWCHCFKAACPTLDCAEEDQETVPVGDCCPQCKKARKDVAVPGFCIFRNKIYREEQSFRPDQCTLCKCSDGVVICRKFVCPVIACPAHRLYVDPRLCCPRCRNQDLLSCSDQRLGKTYNHGESFDLDLCTKCKCFNGELKCHSQQCPHAHGCPKGYRVKKVAGKCCSECEEKEATCTVYGDPHYQTFDGKAFNFQGSCRYILTKHCVHDDGLQPNFTVIVQNDPRGAEHFSWTRHVSIRLPDNVRVSLLPRKRVKVNKQSISVPYLKLGILSIAHDKQQNVVVRTPTGLKVVWDGNSYAEVSVSAMYKGRTCGLCGNYNHDDSDEFISRWGFTVGNVADFGRSWKIGSWRACKSPKDRAYHKQQRWQQQQDLIEDEELIAAARGDVVEYTDEAEEPSVVVPLETRLPPPYAFDRDGSGIFRITKNQHRRPLVSPNNGDRPGISSAMIPKSPALSLPLSPHNASPKQTAGATTSDDNGSSQYSDEAGSAHGIRHDAQRTKLRRQGPVKKRRPKKRLRSRHNSAMSKYCAGDSSKWLTRVEALQQCNLLKSDLFGPCRSKVSVGRYYRSCLMDSCECPPSGRCYCESLLAYAMQCEKENVSVNHWRQHTKCSDESTECPNEGETFHTCAPGCLKTCENRHKRDLCLIPCQPGCACPSGTVLFQSRCIPEILCPDNYLDSDDVNTL